MWSCGESQRTCKHSWSNCPAGPQSSWYGSEAPPSPKGQKRPLAPTGLKGFPAACRLSPGHWPKQGVWLRPLVLLLSAGCCWLLLLCVLLRAVAHPGHRGWSQAACNPAGRAPAITDIKVIHSYWSPERKHFAPNLCEFFSKQSNYLSQVPCMAVPGYHATNATQEQILQLIEDRIVAPETHQHPQGWFTWFLQITGLAASIPLFHPVTESIYHRSYLGTAASHALAINNWTMELMQLPPHERQERNLLLFEDDALVTPEAIKQLLDTLPLLDRCFDVYSLDNKDSYCNMPLALRSLGSWLVPSSWGRPLPPRPTRSRVAHSRNTGIVLSYKGALALRSGFPVTHEIDIWFRNVMTDGLISIYVSCPRILGPIGLPTVV